MKLSTIQKLGGLSIIIGSVLLLAYSILFALLLPVNEINHDPLIYFSNPNYVWIAVVAFVGVIFMIFGFSGVYSKLYPKSGLTGLLGFIFIELAYILQAAKVTWEIFMYPIIVGNQASMFLFRDFIIQHSASVAIFRLISGVTIFIGLILLCISLFRSKEFPKVAVILVFIGAFMYGLGPVIGVAVAVCGVFILSIGCSMLGLRLIKK